MGCFLFFVVSTGMVVMQFEFGFTLMRFSRSGSHPYQTWMRLHALALLVFGYLIWRHCPVICIDIESFKKSIVIKNRFTGFRRTYVFDDLDGYRTKRVAHVQLTTFYDAICLVQHTRVVHRIDSFYYSNFREMRRALYVLQSLGREKSFGARVVRWLNSLVR
jgi:hypothetical protein